MAQFLESVVFSQRKNKRQTTGILEGGEKVELTGLVCDSFFINSIIGGVDGVDQKDNWTFRYVLKRLDDHYSNDGFYIRIRSINISKDKDKSLYVSYDVYMKKQ